MAKRNELEELLGTKNKEEQVEKIKRLQQALEMPVIDLVIRYDPITDQAGLTIVGGQPTFDGMRHILNLATRVVNKAEVKASIDQQVRQNGGQPEHPDLPPGDNDEPSPEMNDPADAGE